MVPVADTRQQLVTAAEEVLRKEGVAGLTTKAVAQAAGRSEGTIYNHFQDRVALVMAVIDARLPEFLAALHDVVPARGALRGNLERLAKAMIRFDRIMLPLMGGIHSDPDLLQRFASAMHPQDKGPHRQHGVIANYLEQEKTLGRLDPSVDTAALALLLIGGCREAVLQELFGKPPMTPDDAPRRIVRTLLPKEPRS